MDEVDACPHCGDPCFCDEACVRDMRRQEEASDAILRITEARVRKAADWLEFDMEEMFQSFVDSQTKAYKEGLDA